MQFHVVYIKVVYIKVFKIALKLGHVICASYQISNLLLCTFSVNKQMSPRVTKSQSVIARYIEFAAHMTFDWQTDS